MRIVLATRNSGKLAELHALLADLPVKLVSAAEAAPGLEVVEDATTLEGNARKKALALQERTGLPALADDTGLEVASLGGRPGVHSARYAGPEADDAANRACLLSDLAGREDRTARFRTVMAFAQPDGEVVLFEGTCEGRIEESERGEKGFGYDALFRPEGEVRTFAEMTPDEKNRISHRGRALGAFATYLRKRLS